MDQKFTAPSDYKCCFKAIQDWTSIFSIQRMLSLIQDMISFVFSQKSAPCLMENGSLAILMTWVMWAVLVKAQSCIKCSNFLLMWGEKCNLLAEFTKRVQKLFFVGQHVIIWTSKSVCSVDMSAGKRWKRRWRLEVERMKFTMFVKMYLSMVFFRSLLSLAYSASWWIMQCKNFICRDPADNLAHQPTKLILAGAPSVTNKQTSFESSSYLVKQNKKKNKNKKPL